MLSLICCLALMQQSVSVPTAPTVKNYEDLTQAFKKKTGEILDKKTWESIEFKDGTGRTTKFSDLDEFDQDLCLLIQGERLTHAGQMIEFSWGVELKKLKAHPPSENLGDPTDLNRKAVEADVEKYLKEVRKLRVEFAPKFEKYAEDIFKKHPDAFTEEERTFYMKRLKELHVKEKLTQ